jgi:hypothetical protein
MEVEMKRSVSVVMMVLLLGPIATQPVVAQGKPANWKLYGFAKPDKQDVEVFYSASELRRNADGNIEVWTKGLLVKAISNAKLDKTQIDDVAKIMLTGYVPLPGLYQPVTHDQITDMLIGEEVANAGNIEPVVRMLFELNCSRRILKILSFWNISNGKTKSSDTPGEWVHTAPETNGAILMNALCPAT